MPTNHLELLLGGLTFGEAPRWRDNKLWFSDFYSHRVMTVDLAGHAEMIVEVPQRPSGLGWTAAGDLLVVSMLDKRVLRFDGQQTHLYADLAAVAGGPCNDMVVDAEGRAYVGNFGYDRHNGAPARTTGLALIGADGSISNVAEDLMFPNGMVITPDGKTLIVGETFANRLTAFDIQPDGGLTRRRVFAETPGCFPDGICLDAEGAVWVTNPQGDSVLRVFEGGRVAQTIHTGERRSFACMLGGADRQTMFVVTNTGSGPAIAAQKSGCIEMMRVDVPGVGLP